jgi:ADP-ribosylglycohydrolase
MIPKAFYSFMGLAVGDAVGAKHEFTTNLTRISPKQTDMEDKSDDRTPSYRLVKGDWTDDTSTALAMAFSIFDTLQINLKDHMEKYVLWLNLNYFRPFHPEFYDVGITFNEAIQTYSIGQDKYFANFNPNTGGNGTLMKLAPIPVLLHKHPELAIEYSGYSGLNTHNSTTAIDCCRYLGALIVGAIQGATKEQLTSIVPFIPNGLLEDYWTRRPLCTEVIEMIANFKTKELLPETVNLNTEPKKRSTPYVFNSGYCLKSLEAVLWHLWKHNSFKEGVLAIANQGHDSDTVAAIYGQVAGPLYSDTFPQDWIDQLTYSPLLQFVSTSLCLYANHIIVNTPKFDINVFQYSQSVCTTNREIVSNDGSNIQLEFLVPDFLPFQIDISNDVLQPFEQLLKQIVQGYKMLVTRNTLEGTIHQNNVVLSYLQNSMAKVRDQFGVDPGFSAMSTLRKADIQETFRTIVDLFNYLFQFVLSDLLNITNFCFLRLGSYCFRVKAVIPNPNLLGYTNLCFIMYKYYDIVLKKRKLSDLCYDTLFYLFQQELRPYVIFEWMYLDKNAIERPIDQFNETQDKIKLGCTDFLDQFNENLFEGSAVSFKDLTFFENTFILIDNVPQDLPRIFESLQPEKMLREVLELQRGLHFTNVFGQHLYANQHFFDGTEPCAELPDQNNQWKKMNFLYNYTKVLLPLTLETTDLGLYYIPAYSKPYVKSNFDIAWFSLHYHLQTLHLQKLEYCKLLCDAKTNEERTVLPEEFLSATTSTQTRARGSAPLAAASASITRPAANILHDDGERKAEPPPPAASVTRPNDGERKAEPPPPVPPPPPQLTVRALTPEEVEKIRRDNARRNAEDQKSERQLLEQVNQIPSETFKTSESLVAFIENNNSKEKGYSYLPLNIEKENVLLFNPLNYNLEGQIQSILKTFRFFNLVRKEDYDLENRNNLNTQETYSLIFYYIGNQASTDPQFYKPLYDRLNLGGKLVVIKDSDPTIDAGYSYNDSLGLKQSPYFCTYKVGYWYYSRVQKDGTCLVNSLFAVNPIFLKSEPRKISIKLPVKLQPNETKNSFVIKIDSNRLKCNEVTCTNTTNREMSLPMNYFEDVSHCQTVAKALSKNWGSVTKIIGELNEVTKRKTDFLSQYFITTNIRGDGHCLFVALNELLVTRGFQPVSLNSLMKALYDFTDLLNFPYGRYLFQDREDTDNVTREELLRSALANYLDANFKSQNWSIIVAFMYNIEICIFDFNGNKSDNSSPIEKFDKNKYPIVQVNTNGTLFLMKTVSHYYPLFPIGDYNDQIYDANINWFKYFAVGK